MVQSLALYTLLALWLLPAVALIIVYCADVLRDKLKRLWVRWTYHRTKRMLSTCEDARSVISLRRSVVMGQAQAAWAGLRSRHHTAGNAGSSTRPYLVAGDAMHVPLVLEDEAGELHTRQWELSLN